MIHRKEALVGKEGGKVRVGGCMLNIPKGALKEEVRLKLVSHYKRNDERVTQCIFALNKPDTLPKNVQSIFCHLVLFENWVGLS